MSVAILMGSKSDLPIAKKAHDLLCKAGILEVDMQVLSAHRNPKELHDYVYKSKAKVFIAFAGMAAHLAGAIAAITNRPVIGVPVTSNVGLGGLDALLSTVQMPKGCPVATVAIDGAENAAILAVQILAIADEKLIDVLPLMTMKENQI